MYVTDIVGLVILMLGTTPQIYGTELEKIENIKVSYDDLYFELKWDPILYNEAQSKSNVRYSVYANNTRYGRTSPDKVQLIDESNKTAIPFDVKPGRETSEWTFTVSASINRLEIARGTKTYPQLTQPGIPITLSPPSVDFVNDCQFLVVNLTAPNEKMKYRDLKYQVDFTSTTGKKIYDQKSLKPDMSGSTKISINETAPMTVRNVCVEAQYSIYMDKSYSSPVEKICSVCSKENPKSQPSSEKWIFIILIVVFALGAMFFFSVFTKKYIKKNGTIQLPDTIKQVITIKLRDVDGDTTNHNRYESPMKIEPVEYEKEPADEAATNEKTASSSSIDKAGITTEYMPLLIDSRNRNFSPVEGAVISDHQESIPQANANETDQSRLTITEDTKNNNYRPLSFHNIDRSNGQVGDSPVLYTSHQTGHTGSDYCSKYLPKHLICNGSSNGVSTLSDSINGGYILKTCR